MVGCGQAPTKGEPGCSPDVETTAQPGWPLVAKSVGFGVVGPEPPSNRAGAGPNQPSGTVTTSKSKEGPAMSEKWGISRVGKLEVEVGETLQEAIIRLQILPLPPLAWTDCFLQTVRGHQVTITGTETHPDKIEAVARPAEVEEVVGKSTPRLRTLTSTLKRWCIPGGKPAVPLRMLKPTRGRNYRPSLTSSRKSSPNPNTPGTRVPAESGASGSVCGHS